MTSFFDFMNISRRITRIRKRHLQLELQYPKNTYDRSARREMKVILTRFNDLFYDAYPMMIKGQSNAIVDYHPRTHSRNYDVQRAIKLCKTQKVRRKDIVKIEEYLNLQFIIEEQLMFYDNEIKKVQHTKRMLSKEVFSSFFPELFEERMKVLSEIVESSIMKIDKLREEKRVCEKTISDLIHRNNNFWGDASRLIGSMVTESVRQVADVVGQSLRRK